MCDYSLHNVKTRPAKVGDKLVTRRFSTGTTGFASPEDVDVAVCLLPGTELRLLTRSRAQVGGPGARTLSPTKPRSSVRSI